MTLDERIDAWAEAQAERLPALSEEEARAIVVLLLE
jgi:hypothetical protein